MQDAAKFDEKCEPLVVQCPIDRLKEQEVIDEEEFDCLSERNDQQHDCHHQEKVIALECAYTYNCDFTNWCSLQFLMNSLLEVVIFWQIWALSLSLWAISFRVVWRKGVNVFSMKKRP